ncbi:MAG: hypothetical protein GX952_03355 [Firmicutes bacterium]|nr:hypothetical protein [Bacillota bacterium]
MDTIRRYGRNSICRRIVLRITTFIEPSALARIWAFGRRVVAAAGRNSVLVRIVSCDWGARNWLAHSRTANGLARFGRWINKLGLAGTVGFMTGWQHSWFNRLTGSSGRTRIDPVRFTAGLVLGLVLGLLIRGQRLGALTGRRSAAVLMLAFGGGLALILPASWDQYADGSLICHSIGWLLNLGRPDQG